MLNVPSTFLMYIGFSIFFNLNSCFLENSELITNPIALLSNSTPTVTPSYILILSKLIFTITSLSISPLSRLHVDILFTTLNSIANLLLLMRPNWGLLDLYPHLNYYLVHFLPLSFFFSCIPVFFSPQFCSLFLYFYSSLPNVQIPCNYNNSYFFCLHPWCMGCIKWTLPSN